MDRRRPRSRSVARPPRKISPGSSLSPVGSDAPEHRKRAAKKPRIEQKVSPEGRRRAVRPSAPKRKKRAARKPHVEARSTLFDAFVFEPPSTGDTSYRIGESGDWNRLFQESYHADVRPAMLSVQIPYRRGEALEEGRRDFSINHQEYPKSDPGKVKMNPFSSFPGEGDVYYSRTAEKFLKVTKRPRKKIALDDIHGNEHLLAQDIGRVMKGTAFSKGISDTDPTRATIAGGLIMTSERMRNPLNPVNAHIELYKVKHQAQVAEELRPTLAKAFSPTDGTFVAARASGADTSRRLVTPDFLSASMGDPAMRSIFENYASKKAAHKTKSFEEWQQHKVGRMLALYPPQRR